MANAAHVARIKQRNEAWNTWREDNPATLPDLRAAHLRGAHLRGANLRDAHLTLADLSFAILRSADLRNANLTRADLSGADLSNADLSGTTLRWTIFADTNLSGAKGLESCKHTGPSSLGIDTLLKSKSEIPVSFLRGCGVPEQLISPVRLLVGQPIEFYSCFISYSSHDQNFTEGLHADLRARSLRCWFAPEDLKIGDPFQERIEESIQVFDKVMIVLSEASVQSRWVEREVNAAREREDREHRTVLFPIRIDDAVMTAPNPWAADIRRSRHIGDFSQWKEHDRYQKAFERLLRDLRAAERGSEQPA